MEQKILRFIGFTFIAIGAMMVFGSVEPNPETALSAVIAFAITGFALIAFGWRVLMESKPRTIFVTKRW